MKNNENKTMQKIKQKQAVVATTFKAIQYKQQMQTLAI